MPITLAQIASKANLQRAWVRARAFAESYDIYYDAEQYRRFESHLTANLRVLRARILKGYQPKPLVGIRIPKTDGYRDLYVMSVWDNVACMAFLNFLTPHIEAIITAKSAGRSLGNRLTTDDTAQVMRDWSGQYQSFSKSLRDIALLPEHYWYMRSDIKEFYPSVRIEKVLAAIAPFVDKEVYDLVKAFLNIQGRIGDDELVDVAGLPIGPAFSHLFANLYLADFDEWIQRKTSHYSRYVDDFFFVAPTEGALLTLLEEIKGYLKSELSLSLHPGKTERYPVTDTACITDTIRRLRYYTQMETPELKAAGLEEMAESLLFEAFIDTQLFKSPKTAAFVAWTLQDLGFSDIENLSEVVCEVLEVGLLTTAEIRRLLTFLIRNNQEQLPNRLLRYLEEVDNQAARIIALDLLDDSPTCVASLPRHLFEALLSSSSFLVRAYAYQTIGPHLSDGGRLEQLAEWYDQESSTFVRSKLIWLLISLYPNEISLELPYRIRESDEVRNAILHSIDGLGTRTVSAIVSAFNAEDVCSTSMAPYVYLLMLSRMKSRLEDYVQAQEIISDEDDMSEALAGLAKQAFDRLLSEGDHFGCYELLGIIRGFDPNLTVEAIDRLRAKTESASETVARRLAQQLEEEFTEAVSQASIWSLEDDIPPQRVFLGEYRICEDLIPLEPSGNGLYKIMQISTGRVGLLELIPRTRLEACISPDDFLQRLEALKSKGICGESEAGTVALSPGAEYTWVVYYYPTGFGPLSEALQEGTDGISVDVRVRCTRNIVSRIQESGLAGEFQSIHGSSVLVDDSFNVYLCCLGTSIVDPTYLFSFAFASKKESLGRPNLSFCLGMLLYEQLTGSSPHLDVQKTKRERLALEKQALNSLPISQGIPHLKYLIGRSITGHADHRYTDLRALLEDLDHTEQYLHKIHDLVLQRPGSPVWPFELVDYSEFRFNIISRSPRVRSEEDSLFQRRRYIQTQLTEDLVTLLSEIKISPKDIVDGADATVRIPTRVRYSSPATQQLVKLSEYLWWLTDKVNTELGTCYSFRVPILVLMSALDFEATVSAYSLVLDLLNTKDDLDSYAATVTSWIESRSSNGAWIGPLTPKYRRVSITLDTDRVLRLSDFIRRLASPRKALSFLNDLRDVAIVVALRTGELHLGLGEEPLPFDQLRSQSRFKERDVLRFVFLSGALENELQGIIESDATTDARGIYENQVLPVFQLLRRIRLSKRLTGRILDYDRISRTGTFEWRRLWLRTDRCALPRENLLSFGVQSSKGEKLTATMDMYRDGETMLSIVTPVSRTPLLALDKKMHRLWMHYREQFRIYTVGILLFLVSIALFLASRIPHGIITLIIDFILILIGLKLDDLREFVKSIRSPSGAG